MPLVINTLQETTELAKADIKNALADSQPFLPNSFLGALAVSVAGRKYDSDNKLLEVIKQSFPQTATGEFLEFLGEQVGVFKNPASKSSGYIIATGIIGSAIPASSSYQYKTGSTYNTKLSGIIAEHTVQILSITFSSGIAKVISASAHDFATGMSVSISGSSQQEYNGSKTIIVTGEKTFEFSVSGSPSQDTSSSIQAKSNQAKLPVESEAFGADKNAAAGEKLTLSTQIPGVDQQAYTYYAGISGGSDIESEDDFRVRVIEAWQNAVANFNDTAIIIQAKNVPGVTRVWVYDCTPQVGQVTIYFVRDNDDNIIPDQNEIDAVKESVLKIKPATSDASDVIVLAPVSVPVNFTFSSIVPDTQGLRESIRSNLEVLFSDNAQVATSISEKAYLAAIFNSIDLETNQKLTDFTLTSPSGAITIGSGQLATLGSISF